MKQSSQYSDKIISGKPLRHIFSVSLIICLVVFALAMIFATLGDGTFSDISYDIKHNREYAMSYFCSEPYIAVFGGFIVALLQFRYLHSKKHSFTMLSFPIKREKLFLRDAFIPLGVLVLITLVIKAVALGINIYILNFSVELLKLFIANVLLILLPLFFSYTVTVGAMLFTGRTSEGIATSISGILLPTALFTLIDNIFSISLYGYDSSLYEEIYLETLFTPYYSLGTNEITRILSLIDPLGNFNLYGSYYSYLPLNGTVDILAQVIKSVIWIAVFITAIILMGKYFSKSYKPEYCGVKGKSRVALTISSFVLPLMTLNNSLYYIVDISDTVVIFEVIASIMLAMIFAIILNMIVYRGVKKILCGVAAAGSILVASVLVIVIGSTGCFGYSTYIPETQKVEKAVITLPFEEILPVDASNDFYSTNYYYSSEEVYIKLTDENDIKLLQDIQSTAISSRDKNTACQIQIIYYLENGKEIPRLYSYISNEAYDASLKLWKSEKVKEFYKIVLDQHEYYNSSLTYYTPWQEYTGDFFAYNEYLGYDSREYYDAYSYDIKSMVVANNITLVSKDDANAIFSPNNFSVEQIAALKKAIYEDISSLTTEQWFTPEKQLGFIFFDPTSYNEYSYYDEYSYSSDRVRISVTGDMKKTIALLEEMGLSEHFVNEKEIKEAHTVDIKDAVKWLKLYHNSYVYSDFMLSNIDDYTTTIHKPFYSWTNYDNEAYLYYVSKYMNEEQYYGYDEDMYDESVLSGSAGILTEVSGYYTGDTYYSDSDSSIPKAPPLNEITPKEAAELLDKAFMTYNVGDNGKFLVIKYTDGTSNILVIPE